MRRNTGVKWGNLKVGLVLIFAVVVMFWASLGGGGTSIFDSKGYFECYFKNVSGLVNGAPVWMSGVEVGNVRSVGFVNLDSLRQVKVKCRVNKSIWNMLTYDARVQLGTIGFLGDKYIEILPGTKGLPTVEEGAIIPTKDAGDATAMFKAGEDALGNVRAVAHNLDTLLFCMNKGKGTLGQLAVNDQLYNNMTALLAKLTVLTADLQNNQERIVSSIEKTANSVADLSDKVNQSEGTIGRLINDPKLYDNLTAISMRMDSIVNKINTAEGTLGLMVSDTALYIEMTNMMVRVNNLVADIEKNPGRYFKFSVF